VRQEESQDVLGKQHAREIASGERFAFGKNWTRYLKTVDEEKIAETRASLQRILGMGQLMEGSANESQWLPKWRT
jgi:hypothetical protein